MTIHSRDGAFGMHSVEFPDRKDNALTRSDSTSVQSGVRLYRTIFKRILDVSLVIVSLPLVLPVILITALLVMLDGHNPFYIQRRVGLNGSVFRMWKLRTMVPNADAKLSSYLESCPAAQAEWTATQKLKKDPRITRVGRVLRKCSLDELPQLLNVLNGTMSLVGPRPMMVQQQELYKGDAYYRLRPGITGSWQVSERNDCDFADRAIYDRHYDRTISLGMDCMILLRTFRVVLRGTGY